MELNRRQFVAGSTLAAAAVAVPVLAQADEAPKAKTWHDRPEPITDIAQVVDVDVVVVGAGLAGTAATLRAVQEGVKTVCIQKSPYVLTHGHNIGALNTRWQAEAGNAPIDIDDIMMHHLRYNNYRPKYEFARTIFEESAPTMEWIAESTNTSWSASKPSTNPVMDWEFKAYVTGHLSSLGDAINVANAMADKAVELGAQYFFACPGVDLVQDETGRVCGVIGHDLQSDTYIQFNAAKGVILATGDYGSDPEMCAELCPWAVGTNNYYNPRDNTGDGHKMGVWVGGKMETAPHTKMAHTHCSADGSNVNDSAIRVDPFLWVNQNGERFANEHMEKYLICNAVREQPGDCFYLVYDANYNEHRTSRLCPMRAVSDEQVQDSIDNGFTVKADTLEECADHFGIDAQNLVATVERYNEIVASGVDTDFFKPSGDLFPLGVPPFYITRVYTPMNNTLGGLMTNTKMQVLDESDKVIEGLYAVGNTSGGFYGGTDYDVEVDAFSLGRAVTTGRLAGMYAAQ